MKFIAAGNLENECGLCKATSIKEFKYWRIIDNRFPWDLIAQIGHIIIPKRHVVYDKLTMAEKKEFDLIKSKYIEKRYEVIAEATNRKKSIPGHFHKHLLVLKDII